MIEIETGRLLLREFAYKDFLVLFKNSKAQPGPTGTAPRVQPVKLLEDSLQLFFLWYCLKSFQTQKPCNTIPNLLMKTVQRIGLNGIFKIT